MMFLLAYIGAPPTIGSPAARAPPATVRAIAETALSSLIFMMRAPFCLVAGLGCPWSMRRTSPLRAQEPIGCTRLHPIFYRAGNSFEWTCEPPSASDSRQDG